MNNIFQNQLWNQRFKCVNWKLFSLLNKTSIPLQILTKDSSSLISEHALMIQALMDLLKICLMWWSVCAGFCFLCIIVQLRYFCASFFFCHAEKQLGNWLNKPVVNGKPVLTDRRSACPPLTESVVRAMQSNADTVEWNIALQCSTPPMYSMPYT